MNCSYVINPTFSIFFCPPLHLFVCFLIYQLLRSDGPFVHVFNRNDNGGDKEDITVQYFRMLDQEENIYHQPPFGEAARKKVPPLMTRPLRSNPPPPPSSLMAIGTFFSLKKSFNKVISSLWAKP